MYGAKSHCAMFMTTTMMPKVNMSKMPAKLRMTAKTKVDKPKIMASVAAMLKRSFQMLMSFLDRSCGAYNLFPELMWKCLMDVLLWKVIFDGLGELTTARLMQVLRVLVLSKNYTPLI